MKPSPPSEKSGCRERSCGRDCDMSGPLEISDVRPTNHGPGRVTTRSPSTMRRIRVNDCPSSWTNARPSLTGRSDPTEVACRRMPGLRRCSQPDTSLHLRRQELSPARLCRTGLVIAPRGAAIGSRHWPLLRRMASLPCIGNAFVKDMRSPKTKERRIRCLSSASQ
jgi:hypothetical protein